jgi:hypothetical protein
MSLSCQLIKKVIFTIFFGLILFFEGIARSSEGINALNPQWARAFGSVSCDRAQCVQQTMDGGYIVMGTTESFGSGATDIWILKLSSLGNPVWQYTYGGNGYDEGYSIINTIDNGYVVAGYTTSFGAGGEDSWVLKLSSNGEIQWQKAYGGSSLERAYSIQQTQDGGYVFGGETRSFGSVMGDFWIVKLSSIGDIEWHRAYGMNKYERIRSIQQTKDGGYIAVGSTLSMSDESDWDAQILKVSPYGDIEWQKTYGLGNGTGYTEDIFRSIQITKDGGYIVAGYSMSFGAGGGDFWVVKLSSKGDIQWQKAYGETRLDALYSIQLTSDGGYIVSGSTWSFGTMRTNIWVSKLSSTGEIEWQKTYGGCYADSAGFIQNTEDGGFIVAGSTRSFSSGMNDYWVLKLSPSGEIGPSCGLIDSPEIQVSESSTVSPLTSNFLSRNTSGVSQNTSITPRITNCYKNLICWNLNQPPENISLKSDINRGLFRAEALNIINWELNPYNSQFVITEYRIYRKPAGEVNESYEKIGSVPSNTFEYIDYSSNLEEKFVYVLTSVDSDGNESPRSVSVGD